MPLGYSQVWIASLKLTMTTVRVFCEIIQLGDLEITAGRGFEQKLR
jgi:hypothetical protein